MVIVGWIVAIELEDREVECVVGKLWLPQSKLQGERATLVGSGIHVRGKDRRSRIEAEVLKRGLLQFLDLNLDGLVFEGPNVWIRLAIGEDG